MTAPTSLDTRFTQKPRNGCSGCREDFASVGAFDRHRVGSYEPLERRCMDETEMLAAGLEIDPHGRWRLEISEADQKRLQELRGSTQSPSEDISEVEAA